MKTFNVTAQAHDMCASNPKQAILINDIVKCANAEIAKDTFKFNMLIEDIIIDKILSVEEITI